MTREQASNAVSAFFRTYMAPISALVAVVLVAVGAATDDGYDTHRLEQVEVIGRENKVAIDDLKTKATDRMGRMETQLDRLPEIEKKVGRIPAIEAKLDMALKKKHP